MDMIFKQKGFIKKNLKDRNGKIWGASYEKRKEGYGIYFDYIDKTICVCCKENEGEAVYFTMEDLKLIKDKCIELGWM